MNKTQKMTMTAMMVSLALAIGLIMKLIPILKMPQGGSFSLAMLPLFILAYTLGVRQGLIGAISYAILNYFLDGYGFHWASFFLDYIIAFGVIGLAGFFKDAMRGNRLQFIFITAGCCALRFSSHVLAGMLAFESTFMESFIYNSMYMLTSTIGVIAVGLFAYSSITQIRIINNVKITDNRGKNA